MSTVRWKSCVAGATLVLLARTASSAPPGASSDADRILKEMGAYLASADSYTFRADITYEALVDDQMILFGGVAHLALQRSPDRLHVDFDSDLMKRRVFFDGETTTVYNTLLGLYAVTESPPEIDSALDRLFETFGFTVPIADLVYSDPYRTLSENVQTSFVVGNHPVNGIPSRHLAFTHEAIDWQIWIEAGPRPVPRRLVITYREEPGSPQYVAELSNWDFSTPISEHVFTFYPPDGASEIEFLPPQEPEEANP